MRRATREWWLAVDRFAIVEGFIGLKILNICRSEFEDRCGCILGSSEEHRERVHKN